MMRARNPKLRSRVLEVQRSQALPPIGWIDELDPWARTVIRQFMTPWRRVR